MPSIPNIPNKAQALGVFGLNVLLSACSWAHLYFRAARARRRVSESHYNGSFRSVLIISGVYYAVYVSHTLLNICLHMAQDNRMLVIALHCLRTLHFAVENLPHAFLCRYLMRVARPARLGVDTILSTDLALVISVTLVLSSCIEFTVCLVDSCSVTARASICFCVIILYYVALTPSMNALRREMTARLADRRAITLPRGFDWLSRLCYSTNFLRLNALRRFAALRCSMFVLMIVLQYHRSIYVLTVMLGLHILATMVIFDLRHAEDMPQLSLLDTLMDPFNYGVFQHFMGQTGYGIDETNFLSDVAVFRKHCSSFVSEADFNRLIDMLQILYTKYIERTSPAAQGAAQSTAQEAGRSAAEQPVAVVSGGLYLSPVVCEFIVNRYTNLFDYRNAMLEARKTQHAPGARIRTSFQRKDARGAAEAPLPTDKSPEETHLLDMRSLLLCCANVFLPAEIYTYNRLNRQILPLFLRSRPGQLLQLVLSINPRVHHDADRLLAQSSVVATIQRRARASAAEFTSMRDRVSAEDACPDAALAHVHTRAHAHSRSQSHSCSPRLPLQEASSASSASTASVASAASSASKAAHSYSSDAHAAGCDGHAQPSDVKDVHVSKLRNFTTTSMLSVTSDHEPDALPQLVPIRDALLLARALSTHTVSIRELPEMAPQVFVTRFNPFVFADSSEDEDLVSNRTFTPDSMDQVILVVRRALDEAALSDEGYYNLASLLSSLSNNYYRYVEFIRQQRALFDAVRAKINTLIGIKSSTVPLRMHMETLISNAKTPEPGSRSRLASARASVAPGHYSSFVGSPSERQKVFASNSVLERSHRYNPNRSFASSSLLASHVHGSDDVHEFLAATFMPLTNTAYAKSSLEASTHDHSRTDSPDNSSSDVFAERTSRNTEYFKTANGPLVHKEQFMGIPDSLLDGSPNRSLPMSAEDERLKTLLLGADLLLDMASLANIRCSQCCCSVCRCGDGGAEGSAACRARSRFDLCTVFLKYMVSMLFYLDVLSSHDITYHSLVSICKRLTLPIECENSQCSSTVRACETVLADADDGPASVPPSNALPGHAGPSTADPSNADPEESAQTEGGPAAGYNLALRAQSNSTLVTEESSSSLPPPTDPDSLGGRWHVSPYYNAIKSIYSMQLVFRLLYAAKQDGVVVAPEQALAMLLASLLSTHGHSGLNDNSVIAMQHVYSVIYNDRSPNSNNTASQGWQLLLDTGFLGNIRDQKRVELRKCFIEACRACDTKLFGRLVLSGREQAAAGEGVLKLAAGDEMLAGICAAMMALGTLELFFLPKRSFLYFAWKMFLSHQEQNQIMESTCVMAKDTDHSGYFSETLCLYAHKAAETVIYPLLTIVSLLHKHVCRARNLSGTNLDGAMLECRRTIEDNVATLEQIAQRLATPHG